MKKLFIASSGNPDRLVSLFRAKLPDFEVIADLAQLNGEPVPYAVVGRPQPGVISAIPGLELILSLNAGVEHLLTNSEIPAGIQIVRLVDEGLALGMADWVLAHALAWHRNLRLYQEQQEKKEWKPQAELLARDRVVTVLGAGALGGPVADHFVRFGFKTRVWSRSGRAVNGAQSFGAADLAEAVAGADILVNLLPLTAETRDLIDETVLSGLKRGALFVNGARGAQVVDADLIAALDSGQLSSAALDVFRTEPLPAEDPYWAHPKVLVSPHVAAPTHAEIAVEEIAANIMRHMNGEPPLHIVDRARGY